MLIDAFEVLIFFRPFRMVAKRACCLRHDHLPLRPSEFISMAPTRRLPIKFDIGDFHENL
jgi:hypothetical protein